MERTLVFNMKKDFKLFIRSHNLIDRIYDMIFYLGIVKNKNSEEVVKKFLRQRLEDEVYVESLAHYFEKIQDRNKNNIELKCNLQDLVYDLNYLKQYLL